MFDVRTRHILLVSLLLLGVFFLWQVIGSPVTISITLGEKKHVEAAGEPLTIDAPVTFTSTNNLTVPKVIDAANSSYFLDPAATGDSLVAAGKVTAGSFAGDGSLLTGIAGTPAGAVVFFNLAACPTGWTELVAARGMYMVGLPASGTLAGTSGAALTNLESRAVGQHNHGISDPGHGHSVSIGADDNCCSGRRELAGNGDTQYGYVSFNTTSATTSISINNAGSVAGTNAPYIQLLTCQKS